MKSYSFINDLFTANLSPSGLIAGRFHLCPKGGNELNTDEITEILDKGLHPRPGQKYPLALLLPPMSYGPYPMGGVGAWERYRATFFFLNTTYYGTSDRRSKDTGTSIRPVFEIWDEMKIEAEDFIARLATYTRKTAVSGAVFRLSQDSKTMEPVSLQGADRASGIKLEFEFSIYNCRQ